MLRLKRFVSAALLLSTFCSASYATEIDLIYNLSGTDAVDSKAAWHGARVAKHVLDQDGKSINLVLYNGQSVPKLNSAIGKMRAQSNASSVVIGLGTPQEITAAAKPVLAANKIFITTATMDVALGNHFFTATPAYSADSDLAATHFESLYQAHFHRKPTAAAYKGYNAVMLAAAALAKGENQSTDQLAHSIRGLAQNGQKSHYPMLMADRAKLKSLQ
jgi:ABC-type branched-subunit amino acid transport system substrate-binding protein